MKNKSRFSMANAIFFDSALGFSKPSGKILMNFKFSNYHFFITIFFTLFSILIYGQNSAFEIKRSNVRIEVGQHILCCPTLPVRLKKKLMKFEGIKDYQVDKKLDCINFTVLKNTIASEQILFIAKSVGFPDGSLKIFIDGKYFP